eukprot:scaffold2779_cov114-Isochrysis_galbana.AAC.3
MGLGGRALGSTDLSSGLESGGRRRCLERRRAWPEGRGVCWGRWEGMKQSERQRRRVIGCVGMGAEWLTHGLVCELGCTVKMIVLVVVARLSGAAHRLLHRLRSRLGRFLGRGDNVRARSFEARRAAVRAGRSVLAGTAFSFALHSHKCGSRVGGGSAVDAVRVAVDRTDRT